MNPNPRNRFLPKHLCDPKHPRLSALVAIEVHLAAVDEHEHSAISFDNGAYELGMSGSTLEHRSARLLPVEQHDRGATWGCDAAERTEDRRVPGLTDQRIGLVPTQRAVD